MTMTPAAALARLQLIHPAATADDMAAHVWGSPCLVPDCERAGMHHGLCNAHSERAARAAGTLLGTERPDDTSLSGIRAAREHDSPAVDHSAAVLRRLSRLTASGVGRVPAVMVPALVGDVQEIADSADTVWDSVTAIELRGRHRICAAMLRNLLPS